MERDCRSKFVLFLFFLIILSATLILVCATGDGEMKKEGKLEKQGPNAAERAIGATAPPSNRPWDVINSWMSVAWINLRHHAKENEKGSANVIEGVMKDVTKSFETSKATVEDAAKLAAEKAGDAVHKTLDKVKKTVSEWEGGPHTEL